MRYGVVAVVWVVGCSSSEPQEPAPVQRCSLLDSATWASYPVNHPGAIHEHSFADLDGDGHLDIAVSSNQTAKVLLGSSDGSFSDAPDVGTRPAWDVMVVDVNADAHTDLVAFVDSPRALTVQPGVGDGTFGTPTAISTGSTQISEIAAMDVNKDGLLDFVVSSWSEVLFLVNAAGVFTPQSAFKEALDPSKGDDTWSAPLHVTDLDGDGTLDVLAVGRYTYDPGVCCNGYSEPYARAIFGAATPTGTTPELPMPTWLGAAGVNAAIDPGATVATGDLDGDGHIDAVHTYTGSLVVSFANGQSSTISTAPTCAGAADWLHRPVTVTDADGDGQDDVVASTECGLYVFLATTDFAEPLVMTAPTMTSLTAIDIDGDGGRDLVGRSNDLHVLRATCTTE